MSTPLLSATHLAKSFGDTQAVKDISFTVYSGLCLGLLGPNGAGKTTTMRMIMGLCTPSQGTLSVFGETSLALSRAAKRRIGLVPQEDNLDPDLTISENLYIYGSYFGITQKELETRVPDLLSFMQLTEKSDKRVNQLSGGMKRRLTIARALINEPDLIILDEPTTGLDPQARNMIWNALKELKKRGKAMILTTHYMAEAEDLCDDIVMIDHGKIIAKGTPAALIQEHAVGKTLEDVFLTLTGYDIRQGY